MAPVDVLEAGQVNESRLPTRPDELRAGLLIFFARPSLLQTWAEFFGHEWRHIGITVQTDEGVQIASYCIRKCFRLDDPADLMGNYNRVGVARVFEDDHEVRKFEQFCQGFTHLERSDSPYTTSAIFIGPIHLLARKCAPGVLRSFLLGLVRLYCSGQRRRYQDRSAYCCSTFAWAGVAASRTRPLRVPLTAHPDDEAAYATPTTELDEHLARWLCGPTEMWQAISPSNRCELDLESSDQAASAGSDQRDLSLAAASDVAAKPRRRVVLVAASALLRSVAALMRL